MGGDGDAKGRLVVGGDFNTPCTTLVALAWKSMSCLDGQGGLCMHVRLAVARPAVGGDCVDLPMGIDIEPMQEDGGVHYGYDARKRVLVTWRAVVSPVPLLSLAMSHMERPPLWWSRVLRWPCLQCLQLHDP